jgi:hypothetical protein
MKKITVGRSETCDVTIFNRLVSSMHAELLIDEYKNVWVKDLASTNGTFVDGQLVKQPTQLNPGNLVFLADHAFDWESAVKDFLKVAPGQVDETIPKTNHSKQKVSKSRSPIPVFLGLLLLLLIAGGVFLLLREEGGSNPGAGTLSSEPDTATMTTDTSGANHALAHGKRQPKWIPQKNPIEYDYSCLDDGNGFVQILRTGADIQDAVIELSDQKITIEDEMKVGDEVKDDILKEYKIWHDPEARQRTLRLFTDLVATIDKPRGLQYELTMIDAAEVNAFTVGGQVFVLRGMYEFIKSDDELAAVLAHEIQHNERGHLTRMLKKIAIAEDLFGDAAMLSLLADRILFASFGQKDEAECDLHGVDHIVRLGFDGCAAATLWERFAKNEKENNFEKLMRSHPYSKDRKKCIVSHIKTNYGHKCRK